MPITDLTAHQLYIRRISAISLVISLVLVVGLSIYLTQQKKQVATTTETNRPLPTIVTPESYQDFIGSVATVGSDAFDVNMRIVTGGGVENRAYHVGLTSNTTLDWYNDKPTGPVITPAVVSDFKVGDSVHVFADENVFPLKEFTATKIYKIITE